MHCALLAVLLAASSPASGRLAAYPLASRGATPEAMQQLDAALRIELARSGVAVSAEEVCRKAIARPCEGNLTCLRAFGQAAGATEVLFGEVHAHQDSFAVTLRLLDVSSGREIASTTASVNRDVEEMVWATRAQVRRLKAPELYAGRLEFAVPGGAELFVAGRRHKNRDPLVLRPGPYAIRLIHSGREIESWVEVQFEQSASISLDDTGRELRVAYAPWSSGELIEVVDLVPRRPEAGPALSATGISNTDESLTQPPSRWPAYAAMGAGVGLLAAGIVQQVRAASFRSDIEALRGPGGNFAVGSDSQVRSLQKSLSTAQLSGWLLVGAGVAAGVGGGVYLFVIPSSNSVRAEVGLTSTF